MLKVKQAARAGLSGARPASHPRKASYKQINRDDSENPDLKVLLKRKTVV